MVHGLEKFKEYFGFSNCCSKTIYKGTGCRFAQLLKYAEIFKIQELVHHYLGLLA